VVMVTKNDFLDKDSIEILADEFDVEVETINPLDELDYVSAYDEIPNQTQKSLELLLLRLMGTRLIMVTTSLTGLQALPSKLPVANNRGWWESTSNTSAAFITRYEPHAGLPTRINHFVH